MSKGLLSQKSRHGFLWVTLGFFLISLVIHWTFAWLAYVEEQNEQRQPVQAGDYFNQTMRDTMENWQSEFLQLMWQVAGLSFLLYLGSPQSKESSERIEAKIDLRIRAIEDDPEKTRQLIREIEAKYPKV
ncbi:MAG: DUF6766 family protein [Nitrososphaera sp.]|uniref:DUF6766 family protein n=1 Tax=Nitrososphaera sp. TaxID=1971748 RepID=UPI003D6EBC4E